MVIGPLWRDDDLVQPVMDGVELEPSIENDKVDAGMEKGVEGARMSYVELLSIVLDTNKVVKQILGELRDMRSRANEVRSSDDEARAARDIVSSVVADLNKLGSPEEATTMEDGQEAKVEEGLGVEVDPGKGVEEEGQVVEEGVEEGGQEAGVEEGHVMEEGGQGAKVEGGQGVEEGGKE